MPNRSCQAQTPFAFGLLCRDTPAISNPRTAFESTSAPRQQEIELVHVGDATDALCSSLASPLRLTDARVWFDQASDDVQQTCFCRNRLDRR